MKRQKDGAIAPPRRQVKKEWVFTDSRTFWERTDLTMQEKAICTILRGYSNWEGHAWPTLIQIAHCLQIHAETADRHLQSLREKKEVSWRNYVDDEGHRRRLYRIVLFKNPWGKITPMAHGGKKPPLTVTIVNNRLIQMTAWCRDEDADPRGCSDYAPKVIEAKFGRPA